jgi:DNA-directed RNA polymerase beta subunit
MIYCVCLCIVCEQVANNAYNEYEMDEYPQGANAVVAVISYTGFDMEDAMIVNKSSYERGFGHASLYKYKKIDLREERVKGEAIHERFKNIVDDGMETSHHIICCLNGMLFMNEQIRKGRVEMVKKVKEHHQRLRKRNYLKAVLIMMGYLLLVND